MELLKKFRNSDKRWGSDGLEGKLTDDYTPSPVDFLCGLMPIGAIACFHMAWNAENQSPVRALVKILLLVPATVLPLLLLNRTAYWRPEWQEFGQVASRYMSKSTAARSFYPLFWISNGIIALSIARKDFTRSSVLTTLSLLTCLMTCLFFAIANLDKEWGCLLQFSMSWGYACGLFLVEAKLSAYSALVCGIESTNFASVRRNSLIVI